jgi:hypothetical protein
MKLPAAPKSVMLDEDALDASHYEYRDGMLRIQFTNQPAVRRMSISW